MKTQIKKWGDSVVVVLSPEFMKFNSAKIGDWIDLADCMIISNKLKEIKDEQNGN